MISVFGWPDPNTGFDQSEHALYTCYFINIVTGSVNSRLMHVFGSTTFKIKLTEPCFVAALVLCLDRVALLAHGQKFRTCARS